MRRRARGIVGLVVLSLGLGVVTTYGVAWWLMNHRNPNAMPIAVIRDAHSIGQGWTMIMESHGGVQWAQSESREVNAGGAFLLYHGRNGNPMTAPSWSLTNRVSSNSLFSTTERRRIWERAAGWPRLAVVERQIPQVGWWANDTREYGCSIRIGGRHDGRRQLWWGTVFAFTPIWGGFAIDVAAFGGGWFVVIAGPRFVLNRRRVAVGRCPKCRYDLSGLASGVCPECGSAVKGRE